MYVSAVFGSQNVSVIRAQMSSTASRHPSGMGVIVVRRAATTGMLLTTNTSFALTSTAVMSVGDLLQINSEVMKVTSIVGQVIGVARGMMSTSVTPHADAATATRLAVAFLNVGSSGQDRTLAIFLARPFQCTL